MSDGSRAVSMLAALPLGAQEFESPHYSLALLPCLSAPVSTRRFPAAEDL